MIRRADEKDEQMLNHIFGHEAVWSWICEDETEESVRNRIGSIFLTMKGLTLLVSAQSAAFVVIPSSSIMATVHTAILPDSRGLKGIHAGQEAIAWVWSNTKYKKLVSWIPVFNRQALYFALKCGFRKEGVVTKSFLKNGELHDQYIVGLSKENEKCQQLSQ